MKKEDAERMREYLGRYRNTLRRLERQSAEAMRWREMARHASGSVVTPVHGSAGQRRDDVGAMLATADSIYQECNELAALAARQRAAMRAAFALLSDARQRDLLEGVYISGRTLEQLAGEYKRSVRTVSRQLDRAMVELDRQTDFFKNQL